FVVGLVASSILLFFCFLKYKNREKAITSPAPKVDYKFSDENRNVIPFFYFFKDYEKEIKSSKISVKTDLLNIISFVKGHTTNKQEVEKSLNNVKKELSVAFILNYKCNKFPLFFESLLNNMICGEGMKSISYQLMQEKNTLDLFNRFGFYFTDPGGTPTRYFFCLKDYNKYLMKIKVSKNNIHVDLLKSESFKCKNHSQNVFLILRETSIELSFEGLESNLCKNFPDLEIYFKEYSVFYKPSEFIFSIDEEDEVIFCCKNKDGYDFYDSNGIIKKFDSNIKITPFAIKYNKKPQE
ncbi:hypothetical protein TUBRATIS_28310, partial [Tubulinosema ratisbonensis]